MNLTTLFRVAGRIGIVLLLMGTFGCHHNDMLVAESTKDISGEWRITKCVRNGVDITTLADFSQFRIHFTTDGKYTMDNVLPFVVSKNGTYALDDPKYPFRLKFTPDGDTAVSTTFNYPVAAGARNIIFTFSPGCGANVYLYTLQRVQP
ncbi:DUF5004 domain-containing protein [Chitinophaga parva]|uniref:DUF5004 domain-containing protein n=1 Tax=Chitinophaga parva TaxID=2169414 RepID=A0A2T7BE79_9BACT|nr:DUF5004 domain-containing protein [Chitinophaga parva]PUZ23387.1 DUF5004 domain-containing protein [Chitinophaga parva]